MSNTNKCHAVTYYFYRLNKCYVSKYVLADVSFRVIRPNGFSSLTPKPAQPYSGLTIAPSAVLATNDRSTDTVANANRASQSQLSQNTQSSGVVSFASNQLVVQPQPAEFNTEEIPVDREFAIKVIQAGLGLAHSDVLDALKASQEPTVPSVIVIDAQIWCHELSIPSPGVLVKGCLDECNVCEDAEFCKQIQRQKVLLARKINALLEDVQLEDMTQCKAKSLLTLSKVFNNLNCCDDCDDDEDDDDEHNIVPRME